MTRKTICQRAIYYYWMSSCDLCDRGVIFIFCDNSFCLHLVMILMLISWSAWGPAPEAINSFRWGRSSARDGRLTNRWKAYSFHQIFLLCFIVCFHQLLKGSREVFFCYCCMLSSVFKYTLYCFSKICGYNLIPKGYSLKASDFFFRSVKLLQLV